MNHSLSPCLRFPALSGSLPHGLQTCLATAPCNESLIMSLMLVPFLSLDLLTGSASPVEA